MRTMWVVILSLVALVLGAFGGLAWKGTKSSLAGLRLTCEVIAVAEKSGAMTKAQIGQSIDKMLEKIAKSGQPSDNADAFGKELKAGCPTFATLGKKS